MKGPQVSSRGKALSVVEITVCDIAAVIVRSNS